MEALTDPFKVRDLKVKSQVANYVVCSCLSHPTDGRNCNIKVASKLLENVANFGYWGMTESRIKSWTK